VGRGGGGGIASPPFLPQAPGLLVHRRRSLISLLIYIARLASLAENKAHTSTLNGYVFIHVHFLLWMDMFIPSLRSACHFFFFWFFAAIDGHDCRGCVSFTSSSLRGNGSCPYATEEPGKLCTEKTHIQDIVAVLNGVARCGISREQNDFLRNATREKRIQ